MASDDERRARAVERLEARRGFWRQLGLFVVLSAFLVLIWEMTSDGGYFWPIWPMAGFGIAIAFQAWNTFGQRPISDADIEREMKRDRESGP
jgi:hypothetical protein